MLKILLSSVLASVLAGSSASNKVYICDSENAVAYHLVKECRGIKPCKEEILYVSKEDAVKRGLRLCGWED